MPQEQPIFLERESYRRRRLGDAAKLTPVLGVVLFLIPMLWAGRGSTAGGLLYLFGAWAVLIVVMGVLSRKLTDAAPAPEKAPGRDAPGSDRPGTVAPGSDNAV